jgi:hypothetical protein
MSLKIIDVIYEKLKNDFNAEGLGDKEIEFIKDMIHVSSKKSDQTVS